MIDKLKSICRATLARTGRSQRAAILPSEASRHLSEPILAALDRSIPEVIRDATANLVAAAYAAGVSSERQRINEIMSLPSANGFTALAWQIAKSGNCDPVQANQALVAAAVDAVAGATAADAERQISTLLH